MAQQQQQQQLARFVTLDGKYFAFPRQQLLDLGVPEDVVGSQNQEAFVPLSGSRFRHVLEIAANAANLHRNGTVFIDSRFREEVQKHPSEYESLMAGFGLEQHLYRQVMSVRGYVADATEATKRAFREQHKQGDIIAVLDRVSSSDSVLQEAAKDYQHFALLLRHKLVKPGDPFVAFYMIRRDSFAHDYLARNIGSLFGVDLPRAVPFFTQDYLVVETYYGDLLLDLFGASCEIRSHLDCPHFSCVNLASSGVECVAEHYSGTGRYYTAWKLVGDALFDQRDLRKMWTYWQVNSIPMLSHTAASVSIVKSVEQHDAAFREQWRAADAAAEAGETGADTGAAVQEQDDGEPGAASPTSDFASRQKGVHIRTLRAKAYQMLLEKGINLSDIDLEEFMRTLPLVATDAVLQQQQQKTPMMQQHREPEQLPSASQEQHLDDVVIQEPADSLV